MAYTLLKAKGFAVGKSRVEEDQVEEMKKLLGQAGDKIVLPSDHSAAANFDFKALGLGALENRQAIPFHTGLELFRAGHFDSADRQRQDETQQQKKGAFGHHGEFV